MIILGANGQLGTAFRRLLPEAKALTRHDLALSDTPRIIPFLERLRPEIIINCAAYTAVDRAEEEEPVAYSVNAMAVREMARYGARAGIPLLTFSTDYVFDGTATQPYLESDLPNPINAYGRTKRAGEELALAAHEGVLVIRSSWVISGTHPNFVDTILRLAEEGEVRVVNDQLGCPTVASDLAKASLEALQHGATGLLHVTNRGEATWFDLAREAVEVAGADPSVVVPVSTDTFPRPAPRPRYSVLGSERYQELGLGQLPHWRDSLPDVVELLGRQRR